MVPPDITQSTTDLELQQGETANLECRADGYPSPAISWRREGDLPIRAKDQKTGSVKKCEPTRSFTKMQGESVRNIHFRSEVFSARPEHSSRDAGRHGRVHVHRQEHGAAGAEQEGLRLRAV